MAKNVPQSPRAGNQGAAPQPKSYEKTIAVWTIVLGLSTIVLAIATAISSIFLYRTDESISKQVETSHVQLRAYVALVSQSGVLAMYKPDAQGKPASFTGINIPISVKNFGPTPAIGMEHWVFEKWYPNDTEPDFSKGEALISDHSVANIAPGQEIQGATVNVPAEDINRFNAKNGRIFIWGDISYKDVFQNTPIHHYHFCSVAAAISEAGCTFKVYKPECNYED